MTRYHTTPGRKARRDKWRQPNYCRRGAAAAFLANQHERAERREAARLLAVGIEPPPYRPRHAALWDVF